MEIPPNKAIALALLLIGMIVIAFVLMIIGGSKELRRQEPERYGNSP